MASMESVNLGESEVPNVTEVDPNSSNIRILISSSTNPMVIRDTKCINTLSEAYNKVMKKHIDKDDEENWNIEIDDINENINFKFVKKSFGQITNTYKTIPDFISYNQAKKRRIQKIQNSINDVRNSIPQRKTAEKMNCSLHGDIDEESLALIQKLSKEDHDLSVGDGNWVRRSRRASGQTESRELKELITLIKSNHVDTIVFKIKHYISSDINEYSMNKILNALLKYNTICESLYIQNFNDGMLDKQLELLTKVLLKGNIWCLNIGENYKITPEAWTKFAKSLANTNVTHMYASEHVITGAQKTLFRNVIRENRNKHDRHNSLYNLSVIEKCTNCWWNPIHSQKLAKEIQEKNDNTAKH